MILRVQALIGIQVSAFCEQYRFIRCLVGHGKTSLGEVRRSEKVVHSSKNRSTFSLSLDSKQHPNREEKLCGVTVQLLVLIIPFCVAYEV